MSRSMQATLTHELWLVCCGRLTHGMLPGWCLCMPDSNLGPALPAGCSPATFCKAGSCMMIVRGAHSRWQGTSWRKKTGGEQRRGTGAYGGYGVLVLAGLLWGESWWWWWRWWWCVWGSVDQSSSAASWVLCTWQVVLLAKHARPRPRWCCCI